MGDIWWGWVWFCLFAGGSEPAGAATSGWIPALTEPLPFPDPSIGVLRRGPLKFLQRDQICFANALKPLTGSERDAEGESVIPAECSDAGAAFTAPRRVLGWQR